ncbi:Tm-1-like ATP-binding domain-containing protein [Membranicola marinus]|uniref:Tm-1-like ATP-binding domain-containing protein n=1 Tax=Membranihabitans marinus TaxID=1227546 RepID=A0A953HQY4_9BACT|nr:Tm-1-like ATP-binding domain-containing protein [Membranihabitans marinus]MBY5960142.1 Tm-1-like ATP-binding domain-containing protein [Membranihabitans marinus]
MQCKTIKNEPRVIMAGTFDTKGAEFDYLHACLTQHNLDVISINLGVYKSKVGFAVQYDSPMVAQKGGRSLDDLHSLNDRGKALEIMSTGAVRIVNELKSRGEKMDGIISMGGGGGTYMGLQVMQKVPFGVPKLCISTLATKDLSAHIGHKDITLMPSIVDLAGLNSISRSVIRRGASALAGMIRSSNTVRADKKKSIAISVFGNTTNCVEKCSELLQEKNYEVLSFHAVGSGGKTMESLIEEDFFEGVLDITTTELADELCGGICSAGPDRLTAASAMNLPQVVAPGCLDMVNFGSMATVPDKYKDRQLYSWAPDVTLMRTNEAENRELGKIIAEKLNKARAPVTILLPLGGLSKIGGTGEVFYKPEIDRILFDAIKENVKDAITVKEINENINTPEFAKMAVNALLSMLELESEILEENN